MRPVDSLVPLALQGETNNSLLKGVGQVAEVVNMAPTEEGTLRTVQGPKDIIERDYPPHHTKSLIYDPVYSIAHAALDGGKRHVLIIHEGKNIKVLDGWRRDWSTIIGRSGTGYFQINEDIPEPRPGELGARFIPTANGIVIISTNGRAYFYDGKVAGYLGYSKEPTPPKAVGPTDSSVDGTATFDGVLSGIPGTNDLNYASDGLLGWNHSIHRAFSGGRLGTTSAPGDLPFSGGIDDEGAGVKGYLRPGAYRAHTQFIDLWGNLSPISGPSDEVRFSQQMATHRKRASGTSSYARADLARKRVLWQGIPKGPRGTVGRLVGRTKDTLNTGDSRVYHLPGNAAPVRGSVATLDDNIVTTYPDNIPDSWLTTELVDCDPVPSFRDGDVAFGRLWIADIQDDPAAIMISMPGRWGTFPKNSRRYPDPKGSPVVAVRAVPQGVLTFTRHGVYLYRTNDSGDDFVREPISTTRGCIAPSSVATLPNGLTIWLGLDGFYGFDGRDVTQLWQNTHKFTARQHNRAAATAATAVVDKETGEYRCWVPVRGSTLPNRCYTTTDGRSWRWRTDVVARGACSLSDDSQVTVVAGQSTSGVEGVWLMDRGAVQVASYIDTGWIPVGSDRERGSAVTVHVRLRETRRADATPRTPSAAAAESPSRVLLEAFRDYRGEVTNTRYKATYAQTTNGPHSSFWEVTPSDEAQVRRARPYWVTFDVDIRSAEAIRFKLSCPVEWEIVEMSFGGQRDTSGKRSI